jgi:hypothetical protein
MTLNLTLIIQQPDQQLKRLTALLHTSPVSSKPATTSQRTATSPICARVTPRQPVQPDSGPSRRSHQRRQRHRPLADVHRSGAHALPSATVPRAGRGQKRPGAAPKRTQRLPAAPHHYTNPYQYGAERLRVHANARQRVPGAPGQPTTLSSACRPTTTTAPAHTVGPVSRLDACLRAHKCHATTSTDDAGTEYDGERPVAAFQCIPCSGTCCRAT